MKLVDVAPKDYALLTTNVSVQNYTLPLKERCFDTN